MLTDQPRDRPGARIIRTETLELRHLAQQARAARVVIARHDSAEFSALVYRDERTATGSSIRPTAEQQRWHQLAAQHDRLVIWAHDESGRTTFASSRALWELGHNPDFRVLVVGRTLPLAQIAARLAARYLDVSLELRSVFPGMALESTPQARAVSIKGRRGAEPNIQAVGIGGAIPVRCPFDLVILDDCLADEHVRTPTARAAVWEWLRGSVLSSLSERGRVIALGTPGHPEDAISRLAASPEYVVHRTPVVDVQGVSTWPMRWPAHRIEQRRRDTPVSVWNRRMLCLPPGSASELMGASEPLGAFMERVSGGVLASPRHLAPLLDLLERARTEPVRAVVSAPPQHGKTEALLHALAWHLAQDPERTHAYVTYAGTLASDRSRKIRLIVGDAGVDMPEKPGGMRRWRTARGGGLIAEGVRGQLTGKSVDGLLIVDDPYKSRVEAESVVQREQVWGLFADAALTRLHPRASAIVVHTRWHEDDLAGRLSKQGWEVINLPAVNEDGTPLWPERYSANDLIQRRAAIGEYSWSSLYMGHPRPRGGAVFRNVQSYDPQTHVVRANQWRLAIGIDLAYTARTRADYSTAVVLGTGEDGRCYVLDVVRQQVEAPQFAQTLRALRNRYAGALPRWYAAGTEQGVVQLMQSMGVGIEALPPKGDKFLRAQPVASAWNSGRILVPTNSPWATPFVDEVLSFTGVADAHDDQVDALAAAYDVLYPQTTGGTVQRLTVDLRRR
jgi:predicted phage terminase large subunit-like protein